MALQTSGEIDIDDIVAEFGGTAPHSINEYYLGGGLVPSGAGGSIPASGQISLDDFYGATSVTETAGYIKTWGSIKGGQTGDGNHWGNNLGPESAQTAFGGSTWVAVAANPQCTLTRNASGQMWGWGRNTQGELGISNKTHYSSPVLIASDVSTDNERTFSTGSGGVTAYINTSGRLKLAGAGDIHGILGRGTLGSSTSYAETAAGGTNWSEINVEGGSFIANPNGTVTDRSSAIALKTDGKLWSWGQNNAGNLAQNNTTDYSSPKQIGTGTDWARVCDGRFPQGQCGAIKTDGRLWAWGQNGGGAIGQAPTTQVYSSPVQTVSATTNWETLAVGTSSHGIKTDGKMWGWGEKTATATNTPVNQHSPVEVTNGGTNWQRTKNSAAIKTDGRIWAWGFSGAYGRVNTPFGNPQSFTTPHNMITGTNWVAEGNWGNIMSFIQT